MAIPSKTTVGLFLEGFKADGGSELEPRVQKALFLARHLQERASEFQTPAERRQQAELDRMLQNPNDKVTLTQITDEAFRTKQPRRAVEHLIHILDVQGIPRFFSKLDRTLLAGFQSFGEYFPRVALPLVKDHMQKETANVILPAEKEVLTPYLAERQKEGVRMNVNFLGEAILSEAEAFARLQLYLRGLQWPEIEVVSIKISTLYSQISPFARRHTIATLCERLERLFRTAHYTTFTRTDGEVVPKFVYLDMEEYRDKELTAEAFMKTLDRPGLENISAGIALQAYIPDSFETLQEIAEWARKRVARGGARITIRIVKGANMEMERVEASIRDWPQAPYKSKRETDANYKRMLHEAMKPENLAAVNIGVASHNLFDVSYGLVLAHESDALGQVQFEMLEGMANHQRRALFECSRNVLLYAPACHRDDFLSAIGYLIRRLDENTGEENFLRYAFRISVDSPEWKKLEQGFLGSLRMVESVSSAAKRTQDRNHEIVAKAVPASWEWWDFKNEPDTDFALPQNGVWAENLLERWKCFQGNEAIRIPLIIAGQEQLEGRPVRECVDPSRPGVCVGIYPQATEADVDQAVACASADPEGWRGTSARARREMLGRVADELRRARGDLMGAALANAGKTLLESDPEVSEATDFAEFYGATAEWWEKLPGVVSEPKGVVVVVPPWNFPIAIPCGGVAAALAAGNTVILKPASDAVLVAWEVCQCFWRAGISKRVLQFLPCAVNPAGRRLVNHPGVNAVILTGGTGTARRILEENPNINLFAETGGKNATIVTALADREQAIKHVVHSAFSHGGQKCSATSLLLLEAEVYDDPRFRQALAQAVESIIVGSAWGLETRMGPLIRPPGGDLEQALKVLEPGEEWVVMPRSIAGNPNLWSPGVKYGVRPGNYTHLTEFFGPVLGVMRFESLEEAIRLVNQTGYGLTSGLESLDEREWELWKSHLHAGNLYINRVTTGAVVLRQPFGGMGKSVYGPGMKAGGPNYVAQFRNFKEAEAREQKEAPSTLVALRERLIASSSNFGAAAETHVNLMIRVIASCEEAIAQEFGTSHDHFRLVGQDNFRRYLPCRLVLVRVDPEDSLPELYGRICAAQKIGSHVIASLPPNHDSLELRLFKQLLTSWESSIEVVTETNEQLSAFLEARRPDRLRYARADRVPIGVRKAANLAGIPVIAVQVVTQGRLECLWYLREQSISVDYHRYGNLGARGTEDRAEVL